MTVDEARHALQLYLRDTGRYSGEIDGDCGQKTKAGVLQALEDGPDTALTLDDYRASAARLLCRQSYIMAFASVEASGSGFEGGRPKILFEPHRFSRSTNRAFDQSHPSVSYRQWGQRPYPRSQDGRYAQLLEAVCLDPWAGFSSASYGKFQILGENHKGCGYDTPWAFAFSQAFDEPTQLKAFESFLASAGIIGPLRAALWSEVARRYNGSAYRCNQYDVKLARAAGDWDRELAA